MYGDGVRVKGTGAERDNGARVHGKVQEGDRAERDNGARAAGAGRGPGQSGITVYGNGARVQGKV